MFPFISLSLSSSLSLSLSLCLSLSYTHSLLSNLCFHLCLYLFLTFSLCLSLCLSVSFSFQLSPSILFFFSSNLGNQLWGLSYVDNIISKHRELIFSVKQSRRLIEFTKCLKIDSSEKQSGRLKGKSFCQIFAEVGWYNLKVLNAPCPASFLCLRSSYIV